MTIRHPRRGDVLPIPLEFTGKYDPDWIWLMGNAVLVTAPAHDVVIVLRIIRFGEMPPLWMHRLFRQVVKESRERGFTRFLTFLGSDREEERKLHEIARRAGARFEPFTGEVVTGVL